MDFYFQDDEIIRVGPFVFAEECEWKDAYVQKNTNVSIDSVDDDISPRLKGDKKIITKKQLCQF